MMQPLPKVLAFMQNQWFRNPERVRAALARYGDDVEGREKYRSRLIEYALFAGCKSGRVLKATLGEELCEHIIWDEASREIGGQASAKFPADVAHIRSVIDRVQPGIVVAFGAIALDGVALALGERAWPVVIAAPHPAARHPHVASDLAAARAKIETLLLSL